MRTRFVSGYLPLPVTNVTQEQFHALGDRLVRAIPAVKTIFLGNGVQETWLWRWLQDWCPAVRASDPAPDPARFPDPYTKVLSNCVMHQKMEWMALAALEYPEDDVFVWIDYGVLKQHEMTENVITDFCRRVQAKEAIDRIEAPGISDQGSIDDTRSCDRFCGSVVIVPRKVLFDLAAAMKIHQQRFILRTKTCTIESNTLAHVEQEFSFPFRWYRAWWGRQMFTEYT